MVTSIPNVKVSHAEAGQYLIHCSCGTRTMRGNRLAADEAATDHLRKHARPDPADQVGDLPELREWVN